MSAGTLQAPVDYGQVLVDAYRERLESKRRGGQTPLDYCYASRRRSCVRAMALDLMHPEDDVPSVESLARMERGWQREKDLMIALMEAGPRAAVPFTVIEGQRRFEIKDRDGVVLIVGKIDGRLKFNDGFHAPFEVKSGDAIRRIERLDDFERSPWTRHMVDQLLAYLLGLCQPIGFLLLDKPDGPLPVEVRLEEHLQRAETFLRDARIAIDVRRGITFLPWFTADRAECARCCHNGKSCTPPIDYGPGTRIITDERLIALADERDETRAAAERYEAADKQLKQALRGVEHAVLGEHQVLGKWRGGNRVSVPEEIKARYTKWDPQHSFICELRRLHRTDTPSPTPEDRA